MAKFQVTLSTGKIVVLSEVTIAMKNEALEMAGMKTQSQGRAFDARFQDELLRCMIHSVNNVTPSGHDKENLDKLFDLNEYSELMMGVQEVMGGTALKKPKVEILTSSN